MTGLTQAWHAIHMQLYQDMQNDMPEKSQKTRTDTFASLLLPYLKRKGPAGVPSAVEEG